MYSLPARPTADTTTDKFIGEQQVKLYLVIIYFRLLNSSNVNQNDGVDLNK